MSVANKWTCRRWNRVIRPGWYAAAVVTAALCAQCTQPAKSTSVRTTPSQAAAAPAVAAQASPVEMVATAAVVTTPTATYEQMAKRDPMGFLQYCWDRYRANVRDYACVFTKQELIANEVLPPQVAEVRVREEPFSVDMDFVENIRECKRALYVEGKWKDTDGTPMALAKPGGALLRAIVPKILQPIYGPRAEKASRRSIDQFGFDKSLELIIKYSRKAEAAGQLDLDYVGTGTIGGRPTFVLERRLPYDGDEENYPDALLIIHIDQEHLVPSACYAYADLAGKELLGSYVYTDVQFNRGFTADDFDPDKINF
jgi:hypothetical protein